ncbi:hypothetical protein CBOM_06802 [Ceraceosorus bombacis]|uniref:SH3 domain-containing protein n=1 Tax=Ceraceosorus bombacis TaxID=401625 RepID=A0A0P1BST4_9BASI|nr:hypothetical protein CBOM_06802 [Ceraceosorus bombacis]
MFGIALALGLSMAISAKAQGALDGQCVSLQGSVQCPSFQDAYINPQNLSSAWPWFASVTNVTTFDQQFAAYFTDPNRFLAEKLGRQLACNRTAALNTTLQYERTILCGQFSQISYSAQCNVANRADPIMVCQDTCLTYSAAQSEIVQNPAICTPDANLTTARNTTRYNTLQRDYVTCTDWTSLVSTNNQTCVEGDANEGNCGFGPGISNQLCAACDPSGNRTVPACCYANNTALSGCASYGHPGAAAILPTTSVGTAMASPTASSSSSAPSSNPSGAGSAGTDQAGSSSEGTGLSRGGLAGLIVGVIIGALVLGGLAVFALLGRKRRNESGAAGVYPDPNRPISGVTTSSGTDGRGTTVASARDQYTGQEIFPGEDVIAVYPYNASLNDELTLEPDQRITIVRLYDDGWALGRAADGQEGALPLVCVSSTKGEIPRIGGGSSGTGTGTGTETENESGNEAFTSGASVDGAVTADEGGFTSDASRVQGRR